MAVFWYWRLLLPALLQMQSVIGESYRVTTLISEPFVMDAGDGTFKGYLIDVLDGASKLMNFSYTIEPNRQGRYGMLDLNNNWTGMIGDLVHGRADIAAADLTATHVRSLSVSHSQPFLETGLRILVRAPPPWHSVENLFAIMSPLSPGIWIASCLLALVVVSVLSFIGRFSPWERQAAQGGVLTLDTQGTTLANSFMVVLSGWTGQGSHPKPRSVSGRIVTISWWIFSIFFLVVYSANLVAFFVTREPALNQLPFTSFEGMVRQTEVEFGYVKVSSTQRHFSQGTLNIEKSVWAMTKNRPDLLVSNSMEGIQRVRNSGGRYAFIMEGVAAEYAARQPPCDLSVVGEARAERVYSFACRDDTVCSLLDVALLKMKETDDLHFIRQRWFAGGCESSPRAELVEDDMAYISGAYGNTGLDSKSVSLYRFAPGILILVIGILLSATSLAGELILAKYFIKPIPNRLSDERMGSE